MASTCKREEEETITHTCLVIFSKKRCSNMDMCMYRDSLFYLAHRNKHSYQSSKTFCMLSAKIENVKLSAVNILAQTYILVKGSI